MDLDEVYYDARAGAALVKKEKEKEARRNKSSKMGLHGELSRVIPTKGRKGRAQAGPPLLSVYMKRSKQRARVTVKFYAFHVVRFSRTFVRFQRRAIP